MEFVAYETELPEGEEALLEKGDNLKVQKVNDDGGLVCIVVDGKGEAIKGRQGDTLFPEEVKLIDAESAPKAARTRSKPAAKAAAKTGGTKSKPKAKAKIAGKGTSKGKGKAKPKAKAGPPKVGDNSKTKAALDAPVRPAIQHNEEVIRLINEQGAIVAVKALLEQVDQTYFNVGGLLTEISESALHEHHGYEGTKGFHDFVETELGIAYQKARNLIEIYEVFRDPRVMKKLTASRLKKLGWSKAKQLARLGADQLIEHWDAVWDMAVNGTRDELIAHIKTNYVVATRNSEKVKVTRMSFALLGEAANTVTRALDQAKELVGDDDGNKALEYMSGDWLNLTEGVERETFADLDAVIAYAADKFDAVLTQVDSETEAGDEEEPAEE